MVATLSDVRLTRQEIAKLVYKWIGVSGGYLGDFSYARHDQFWLDVCDLPVDTGAFGGTTRECFETTLFQASAVEQAAVLRAILERYPREDLQEGSNLRSTKLQAEVLQWIWRLETGGTTVTLQALSTTQIVQRALDDADVLLKTSRPQSAVDRVHTAFHGYLHELAIEAGISGLPARPTMTELFKAVRSGHPALAALGPQGPEIARVFQAMATILDALNPVRNNASVAHPTGQLVGESEAVLVINCVRTLLGYLEAKRREAASASSLATVP